MIRRLGHSRSFSVQRARAPRLRAVVAGALALAAVAATPFAHAASSAQQGDRNPPSAPGPLVVTAASQSSVVLTWLPATDDVAVTSYGVFWNSKRPKDMELTPKPTFTKSGLTCNTSYVVKVVSFDAERNHSLDSSDAIVSTSPCVDANAPSPPSGITQIARTQSTATLTWNASSDDVGVAGYAVSVGGVLAGTTAGTSYTVTGLTCGSWYTAVVQAYDAAGNRSTPGSFAGTTADCTDTKAPAAPTGLSQVSRTTTSMAVGWSASAGATRYGVYVDGGRVTETTAPGATVSSFACDTTHSIAVDAADAAGRRSARTSAEMATAPCPSVGHRTATDTTPPTTPAGIAVTSVTSTSAAVRWSSSSDNVGVVGYSVYKNGAPAGDTPGTSFLVPSIPCGTSAVVGVEARDAAGNRSQRATVAATTAPCGAGSAPTMPGAVTLQNRTETSITFWWAPSTDTGGVAGYGVYVDGKLVDTTTETPYTVAGLTCGGIYTIGVDAFDAEGNRSSQSTTLLTTSPCSDVEPPSAPTGLTLSGATATSLDAAWGAATDDVAVAGYDVFVDNVLVITTKLRQATLSGLGCGSPVAVAVEAFDAAGNRSARAIAKGTTAACTASGALFVAPGGSDSSSCAASAPCATFGRAYQVAKPGQVVEVGPGSYPYQRIEFDATKSSADRVVFQAAPGGTVSVTQLDFGQPQYGIATPRHVELNGLRIGYTRVWPNGEDIVLRNLKGNWFDVLGGTGVSVLGGAYGPCQAPAQGSCTPRLIGTNQTVDGTTISGMTSTDLTNYHVDGIFVRGCQSCRISRSKFSGNMIANIRLQDCCSLPPNQNVTIENNWFAAPLQGDGVSTRTTAIDIDNAIPNLLIRNNSFAQNAGMTFADVSYGGTNARVVNNLMQNNGCVSGVTYASNLFVPFSSGIGNTPCSSTDRQVSIFGYLGGGDFHIAALSPAVDAADSRSCPSVDYDGQSRSAACDVGSDER